MATLPLPLPEPSAGGTTIMLSRANSAQEAAYQFLDQLGALSGNLQPPVINPVFPTPDSAPPLSTTSPPDLQAVSITPPTAPAALGASLNVDELLPAPFDDAPPVLSFGVAPATFSEVAPSAPGVDTSYVMPDLSLALPAPPNLLSLSIAPFDGVTLPTLTEDVPELTAVEPTPATYVPGAYYNSALLTQLEATLADRIANGGTGIPAAAENAIWDRQREREFIAADDAIRDLERMESMGFALPPGVYMDARYRITTEMRARQISLGREIMIKQAELEMENIRQSLTIATQLEGQLLNYNNQVEQRLFEASKFSTQAAIEIYNAKVRAYSAYLDAYKTKVNIYEAQIRGELAKVEVYKAQLQAEQAKADVNNSLVNQFKVQTDAALANVEVFKAQVLAIQSKAELEKLKINIYGEQVRAYAAKISAYTASVEGFKATLGAETAKQEAYKSQVLAYSSKVEAQVKVIDAKIEEYKGRIMAKTSEWEGYKAAYQGEASRAQAITSSNQSLIEGYKGEVAAVTGFNEVLTKQWQVSLDQAQRSAEIGISAAKANADLYMTTRGLALDAAKVGAQVSAQIAAASINTMNYSFSNSVAASSSNSASDSDSRSTGVSTSTNTNTNTSTSTGTNTNTNTNTSTASNINTNSVNSSNTNLNSTFMDSSTTGRQTIYSYNASV
jgi:hypothetical protein